MKDFVLYFNFGLDHILTWSALDHILFVAALCLRYQWNDWKKILILITAFTIGHCSTLVLSTYNIVSLRTELTEFLIALSIVVSSLSNIFVKDEKRHNKISFIYFIALLFGMVHGLGFAYGLKSILGRNENIIGQLLSFNIGIEIAQLFIVLVVLIISFAFIHLLHVKFRTWLLFTSGIIFGLAFQMCVQRVPHKKNKDETTVYLLNDADRYECCRSIAVL